MLIFLLKFVEALENDFMYQNVQGNPWFIKSTSGNIGAAP